ncbi:hypothetical protein CEXT_140151 [Caerostris extrusa]|uniref:Uncharacterized protein n=1 Tax=Caerostris extrusa TaxID=172846 RepID=A0AAV4TY52_CAEEX|nr:hypothetical protein CEXT_140151 [Caerostris extrusa]
MRTNISASPPCLTHPTEIAVLNDLLLRLRRGRRRRYPAARMEVQLPRGGIPLSLHGNVIFKLSSPPLCVYTSTSHTPIPDTHFINNRLLIFSILRMR